MLEFYTKVTDEKDLFFKLIELYQSAYYYKENHLTKREMDFLWTTFNVQKDVATNKLFESEVLEEYEKHGMSYNSVNKLSKSVSDKGLGKRDRGEFYLVDVMNRFSSKKPLQVKIDITYEPT